MDRKRVKQALSWLAAIVFLLALAALWLLVLGLSGPRI